jgi:hypothetical protein
VKYFVRFVKTPKRVLHMSVVAIIFLLLGMGFIKAGNKTFTGPGNFSNATKWNGNSLPVAGDDLKINSTCSFDDNASNLAYGALNVAGTLSWPAGGTNTLNVSDVSSSSAGSAIDMTNGGTLEIRTSWTTTNQTFTPGTGTIIFAGTQTMPAAITTYNNLTINIAGGTVTLGAATTVNGTLLISAGTLSVGASNYALNVKGNFTNNATFTQGGGTVTLNGTTSQAIGGSTATAFNNLTISNTNAPVSATASFSVGGTLTVNASAVLSPAAAVVISGGGTLTGSGTVQVTRTAATADFGSQYTITYKTLTNLTVDYNGTAEVLSNLTYGNLKVSGSITGASNTATVGGIFTVTGTFTPMSGTITMNNGSSISASGTLTFSNLTIANSATVTTSSSFTIGGTLTAGTGATLTSSGGTITMSNGSSVSGSGTLTFNNVTVPSSATVTASGNVEVNGTLTVNSGAVLTPTASAVISGTGTLTGDGTVQVTRTAATADFSSQYTIADNTLTNLTVEYVGTVAQTISPVTYGNLKVNNSNGVSLGGATTVNGTLTLTSGNVSTGSNTLTLGSSATLSGESAGRYIVGNLTTTRTVGTGSSTFGGIGVSLNAGVDNLADMTVTRVSGSTGAVTVNTKTGINRKWAISSTNPPTNGRDLTLSWVLDDDNGKDLTTAQVWKSTDGGTTWFTIGNAQNVSGTRSITVTTSSFSAWTVSDGGNPLPIQLASFAASVIRDNDVQVSWRTVSETNNYGFEICRKRGQDANWSKIAFVKGNGTTLAPHSYFYTDRSVSFGKYYYQIKQIDLDGRTTTFPEMEVTIGLGPDKFILAQNYPNPFNPSTSIEFAVPMNGRATIKVYNVLGQEVATVFEGNAEAGRINTAQFNASNLPSGPYFYTLRSAGQIETKRMLLTR